MCDGLQGGGGSRAVTLPDVPGGWRCSGDRQSASSGPD